jgi:hypothetical protein
VGRPERWAWQVPNTLYRLARGQRLSERTPQGPLYGPATLANRSGAKSRGYAPPSSCFSGRGVAGRLVKDAYAT